MLVALHSSFAPISTSDYSSPNRGTRVPSGQGRLRRWHRRGRQRRSGRHRHRSSRIHRTIWHVRTAGSRARNVSILDEASRLMETPAHSRMVALTARLRVLRGSLSMMRQESSSIITRSFEPWCRPPGVLGCVQSSHTSTHSATSIARPALSHRLLGVGVANMAGLDPRDGSSTVRDQHRLPAPDLPQQCTGSCLASLTLARPIRPLWSCGRCPPSVDSPPTSRQQPETLLLVGPTDRPGNHPPTCQPPPENPS